MATHFNTFPDPVYAQNSRVVVGERGQSCWIIDPGFDPATSELINFITENDLKPKAILLTHAHIDHIVGLPALLDACSRVPVYLAQQEWSFLSQPTENLSIYLGQSFQVNVQDLNPLSAGQELALDGRRWQVLETPGHSPGGRTFYSKEDRVAIVGDTLFAGSVGRTDFPHSDGALMFKSIRETLLTLPDDTRVLPGHGPETTIAVERKTNPFLTGAVQLER